MLSELFEALPEVGDLDKPKLVFFFDEAHLLFTDAPKALLSAIEQVVRLIRSKGVGVYFITQNPLDVPDTVLGQLGNRIQHVLRAFTPRDQKAVRAAAETFRDNRALEEAEAIMQLGVGEALVSMLDAKGTPEVVERTLIAPPSARVGPISPEERKAVMAASAFGGKYDTMVDRESAFEMLQARAKGKAEAESGAGGGLLGALGGILGGIFGKGDKNRMSPAELAARAAIQSAARSAGTQIARQILRGVLGGMSK
jgi:DNA helicase HerA-like ATPase